MNYLIASALLVNLDMITFFFVLPYQIADAGGAPEIVNIINIIHALIYVISAGLSGRLLRECGDPMKILRLILGGLSAIYTIDAILAEPLLLLLPCALHSLLLGIFWPAFWAAFYRSPDTGILTVGTEMILTMGSAVFGPVLAGAAYRYTGRYVLLVIALLTFIVMLLMRSERDGSMAALGSPGLRTDPGAENSRIHIEHVRILILLLWLGAGGAGCLDGLFRSAAAAYLKARGKGPEIWGMLQSVKILSQILSVAVICRIGENRFAFQGTRRKLFAGFGALLAGSAILSCTVKLPFLIGSMVLLGSGCGVLLFLCMHIGSSLSGSLNQNLNGFAESITGAGILAGSVLSGVRRGNPFISFSIINAVCAAGVLLFRCGELSAASGSTDEIQGYRR